MLPERKSHLHNWPRFAVTVACHAEAKTFQAATWVLPLQVVKSWLAMVTIPANHIVLQPTWTYKWIMYGSWVFIMKSKKQAG